MKELFTEKAYRRLYQANRFIMEQSYKEAAKYLILPAREGIPEAMTNMGTLRFKGLGLQKDTKKAVYWYKLAAKKGCKTALYNLSICYRIGYGTEINSEKALVLLFTAAKLGLVSAQYQLGKMSYYGESMEQSTVKAIFWYKKAADAGHKQAQLALAELFRLEQPNVEIQQDLIKAHLYANLALHNGSPEARDLLELIEGNMVGRQRDVAKRLYVKWGKNYERGYGYSCHKMQSSLSVNH